MELDGRCLPQTSIPQLLLLDEPRRFCLASRRPGPRNPEVLSADTMPDGGPWTMLLRSHYNLKHQCATVEALLAGGVLVITPPAGSS